MPKYLCILRNQPNSAPGGEKPSPAQMEEMYANFNAWRERFEPNIVDLGGKLTGNGKVMRSEGISDGPFVEAKEIVGGFMILSAKNLEEALEVAGKCPGVLSPGNSLEVREMMTF